MPAATFREQTASSKKKSHWSKMQAVRLCSTCAVRAGGPRLGSPTHLPARTEAASRRLLSTAAGVLISSREAPKRKSWLQRQARAHASAAPLNQSQLSAASSLQQAEQLTHEALIGRATSLVADGAGTLLSQSTFALVDALHGYAKAVHTRVAMQRRFLMSLGKLSPAEEDSLQRAIFEQKAQVGEHLDQCQRFESTWSKAVDLCQMAAQAAYESGSEQASVTLTSNVRLARAHAERARQAAAAAEKKLARTKADEIHRLAEYAASLEDADELEIQEAYLRED